jgi:transposase InsO family protein
MCKVLGVSPAGDYAWRRRPPSRHARRDQQLRLLVRASFEASRQAVVEAFFPSLKSELADRFDTCGDATMELFDYIEVFYNQRRRHSTLGQISPAAFEKRAATQAA